MPDRRVVAGVTLRPEAAALLEQVEKAYGLPVRFEEVTVVDPYYGGQSKVEDGGVPAVIINSKGIAKEATVVHELFHLKMRKEGYPVFQQASSLALNEQLIGQIFQEVNDPILHSMFFPEIRKMGLNPNASPNAFYRHFLDSGDVDKEQPPFGLAITLMKITLECTDSLVVKAIKDRLRKNGKTDSIILGEKLANIVAASRPQTPEEEVDVVLSVLNTLFTGEFSFKVYQWGHRPPKGSFVDRTVTVLIEPSRS